MLVEVENALHHFPFRVRCGRCLCLLVLCCQCFPFGLLRQCGSKSLNNQLRNLDAQFYARLSATLAELDTCIQAMVNGNTRR